MSLNDGQQQHDPGAEVPGSPFQPNQITHSQYKNTMNRHTSNPMKRDTSKIPRPKNEAWRLLVACIIAVFAAGFSSAARAQSANFGAVKYTLTGESGCGPANSAVEPGERVTVAFTITNKTASATSANFIGTLNATGGVLTPNGPLVIGVIAANSTKDVTYQFTASGSCGQSLTATIQLNDAAINYGTIAYTIPLGGTLNSTGSKANGSAITMPVGFDRGPFTPYPSTVTFAQSDFVGSTANAKVSKVVAKLNGLTHSYPDDFQFLLVGPTGKKVILMANAGGGNANALAGANIAFDDVTASLNAPTDEGALVSGTTYRTSNYAGVGEFDKLGFVEPNAPEGPYDANLTAFNGENPVGVWKLFAYDRNVNDAGSIAGGWSLDITVSEAVCNTSACTTLPSITGVVVPGTRLEDTSGVVNFNVQTGVPPTTTVDQLVVTVISSTKPEIVPVSGVVIGPSPVPAGSAARTATVTPAADANGSTDIKLRVTDPSTGLFSETTFTYDVAPVNDAPTISAIGSQSTAVNTDTGVIAFTVGDKANETAAAALTIIPDSSNTAIVANTGFTLGGSGASRTVKITPVNNAQGTTQITLTVIDEGGLTATSTFLLTVGIPSNTPVISALTGTGGQTVNADGVMSVNADDTINNITFTVVDANTAAKDIVVTAVSSNPGLVPNVPANLSVTPATPTDANRALKIVLAPHQFGQTLITVTAKNGAGNTASKVLTLNVVQVNTAPTITTTPDTNPLVVPVNKNQAAVAVLNVNDIQSGAAGVTLTTSYVSGDATLVPLTSVSISNPGGTLRTFSALPKANASGTVTLRVTASDGALSSTKDIQIVVNNNNLPPSFTKGADQTVLEDATPVTVTGWATAISQGAGESGQAVNFTVSNNNNPLFSVQPAVSSAGVLTYSLAPNANGSAVVSVVLNDDGVGATPATPASSAAQTFTITVTPVNDRPTFSAGASNTPIGASDVTLASGDNITVLQDYPAGTPAGVYSNLFATLLFNGGNPGTTIGNEGSQTTSFVIVTNDNSGLFEIQPIISQQTAGSVVNGYLYFKVAPKKAGTAKIEFVLKDNGGTANGGADTSGKVTFSINVTDTIDATTISGLAASYTLSKNAAATPIQFRVNDPDVAGNEDTRILVSYEYDANANNLATFVQGSVSGDKSARVLLITPKPNITSDTFGTGTVKVKAVQATGIVPDAGSVEVEQTFTFRVENINNAPTITLVTTPNDITMSEDAKNVPYTITVADGAPGETAPDDLAVSVTTTNSALFSSGTIFLAKTASVAATPTTTGNATWVIFFSPAPGKFGTDRVTVSVTDTPQGSSPVKPAVTVTKSFNVTVTHVNHAPTIVAAKAKESTVEDTAVVLTLNVADVDSDDINTNLVINSVVSTNTVLLPNANIVLGGSGATRTATVTPAANLSGLTRIDFTVTDGKLTSSVASVLLTVLPINDEPVLGGLGDKQTDQNTNFSFTFTLSDVETAAWRILNPGQPVPSGVNGSLEIDIPTNPGGVIATAVLDNGADFTNGTRKVNITLAPNTFGEAVVRLRATDTGDTQVIPTVSTITLAPVTSTNLVKIKVVHINQLPTITPIADVVVEGDTASQQIAITIGDVETAADKLVLTGSSDNVGLLPVANIQLSGTLTNRIMKLVPASFQSGTANVTITVADLDGGTASRTFKFTVKPKNHAPTISEIPNQTTAQNSDTAIIPFTVSDPDGTPAGSLSVSVAGIAPVTGSDPVDLVKPENVFFGGSGGNRALIITPTRNRSGSANITISVKDPEGLSSTRTFKLTVSKVNTAPSISAVADQSVSANGTLSNVGFIISDLESPSADLVVRATSSNTTVIPNESILIGGGLGTNRTAFIVPAKDQSGDVIVTLTVNDPDGGTASSTFTVHVIPINQAPKISAIPNQTTDEDTKVTVLFSVVDNDSASVEVTVKSGTQGVIPDSGLALSGTGTNKTLVITPASNQSGTSTITVSAKDTEGLVSTATFTVTVNALNDLPTITVIANQTTKESTPVSALFSVGDTETVVASLTVAGSSSNTALVPNANITFSGTGAIRTVTVTPVAGNSGVSTITVTVSDTDGGSRSSSFTLTVTGVNKNDVNGDGLSDLFFQTTDGFLAVWFMNGRNQIGAGFLNPTSTGDSRWRVVGSGDFNGDGKGDVLFQHQDGTMAAWFMNGTNLISAAVLNPSSPGDSRWSVRATADIDLDGKRDIIFQHTDGTIAIWYMNGTTLVKGELLSPSNPGDPRWRVVAAGDFNGDGKIDLVFQHSANRTLAVWYLNGNQLVDSEQLNPFDPQQGWEVAACADYNGDGQADLVFQHEIGSLQVWFMKGPNGTQRPFLNPVTAGTGWTVVAPK